MQKPSKATGTTRLKNALGYSLNGLRTCFRKEEAFRQEAVLFIVLLPLLAVLDISLEAKLLLLTVNTLVLIVELLNSAIEAIVDKTSPEFNKLAGRAKDMASSAVFCSLLLAAVVWAATLFTLFT